MDATRNARVTAAEKAVRIARRRVKKASPGQIQIARLRLKDSVTAALKVEGDMWLAMLAPRVLCNEGRRQ